MAQRGHNLDPTQSQVGSAENQVRNALEQQYARERAEQVDGTQGVHVRDLIAYEDLESGGDNGWNGNNEVWEQTGLSDGTNTVYDVDSDSRADLKMIAITGLVITGSTNITEVRFQTSPGGTFERAVVQAGKNDEEARIKLADPVYYGLNDAGSIVFVSDGGGDENIVLEGHTAEKAGNTLAKARDQFASHITGQGPSNARRQ